MKQILEVTIFRFYKRKTVRFYGGHMVASRWTDAEEYTKEMSLTKILISQKWVVYAYGLIPVILRVEGTGSRFSACSFIKMLFFCRYMLYRLSKQNDRVKMLSKNQSAHSPGSHLHLINLNICKELVINPSDVEGGGKGGGFTPNPSP